MSNEVQLVVISGMLVFMYIHIILSILNKCSVYDEDNNCSDYDGE